MSAAHVERDDWSYPVPTTSPGLQYVDPNLGFEKSEALDRLWTA
eukprot:CAMPEP_0196662286 /NCGR_PEP_ID=MMETSP1086-20130531/48010_1 /TAXON_ID=77921 /ORGANISM="Cyanoptyche  gloeocystis , Strain SAG4.97" /LENGTH=43 /DNA_ID= /DNA_START= /DNA_END= /DNA_ORIENTATION=